MEVSWAVGGVGGASRMLMYLIGGRMQMDALQDDQHELNLDVRKASNLRNMEHYIAVMGAIEHAIESNANLDESGTKEEFMLISRANDLDTEIQEHELKLSKFVKDIYAEKFPELESLIPDSLDYIRAVQCIGNEMDITHVDLDSVLPGHTSMIVRIGASTTDGRPLSKEKIEAVFAGCAEALALHAARQEILSFIESRMSRVAPNLSALVGSHVAAQLMTTAGGLEKLAAISSNALRVLGIQKRTLQGLSTKTQIKHVGFLQHCDLVQQCPSTVRTQAIRILAGKCALAARCDAQAMGRSVQATVGLELRAEVEGKIATLVAPPPPRTIKALPVPRTGEGKVVKRGGEQARRKKAKYKMTELRKQQNRLAFGEVKEEGLNDIMGADSGVIGTTGVGTGGKLRVAVEDTGILKGLSKKRKMEIQRAMEPGQGSRTVGRASHLNIASGMKSSLALEGDRGIELVDTTMIGNNSNNNNSATPAQAPKYFGNTFAVPAPVMKKK